MPRATTANTISSRPPTRRCVITGAASLAVAGAALATTRPAHANAPDAELIGVCAAFDALERQYLGMFDGPSALDEAAQEAPAARIRAAQAPLLDRLCALRAATPAGLVARARTMLLEDQQIDPRFLLASPYTNERLMGAFLRDVTAQAFAGQA